MSAALDRLPRESRDGDPQLIARVLAGETDQFAVLVRRYNERLFRAARSITRDESEAEDVVQHAFVAAFQNLGQFEGRAQFSTWLTRIAVNEAFKRKRKSQRFVALGADQPERTTTVTPEHESMRIESRAILETALDQLADHHRVVFVLRDVEELDTAETAEVLGISEAAVRTRLHRARAALRQILLEELGLASTDVYPFAGARCDRIVAAVFASLELAASG